LDSDDEREEEVRQDQAADDAMDETGADPTLDELFEKDSEDDGSGDSDLIRWLW
jgi:hypothetical protein